MAELFRLGIARPLSELADSQLQKIKSTNIAEAAESHNKALLKKAEAEKVSAEAELLRASARKSDAKTRTIDIENHIRQIEHDKKLVQEQKTAAQARLEAAVVKLQQNGGGLYLENPQEPLDIG